MTWGGGVFKCLLVLVMMDLNPQPAGGVERRDRTLCDGSPTFLLAHCQDLQSTYRLLFEA